MDNTALKMLCIAEVVWAHDMELLVSFKKKYKFQSDTFFFALIHVLFHWGQGMFINFAATVGL